MKYLYVSITFFLSVSCAIHTGNTTGNAELQGSDFEIIDIGYGEAHTFKIFGIGGLSTNTLVYDAKKDLYRRYPLKKGQAYANVSIDLSGIARKGELKQYYEDESEGRYCLVSFGASETRAVSESQVFGIQEVVITTSGDTLRVEDECTTTRYGKPSYVAPGMIGKVVGVRKDQAILKYNVNGRVVYQLFNHKFIRKL
jgi:hypothetical protein